MQLTDAISPDWKECSRCKKTDFVPQGHTECYECLNITFGRSYKRFRKVPIPSELRLAVFERDGYTCKRCGSNANLHADHIIAESKGGHATMDNLQTLCRTCNCKKGAS